MLVDDPVIGDRPVDDFALPRLGAGSCCECRSPDPNPRAAGAGLTLAGWLDKERDDWWREAVTKLPLLPPFTDSSPDNMISIKFLSSFAMSASCSSGGGVVNDEKDE